MDLFEKLKQNRGPLGEHAHYAHGYFSFPKLEGPIGSRMMFRGKEKIVWSINSYLGLANHPEVRKADGDASTDWGLAYPMGSRMMSGNTSIHENFEAELAEFVHKEDAILLNFGYQGIMSAIDALLDRRDVVVYDEDCHACIVDGVRLHLGKRFKFKHNDAADCEKQLQRATRLVEKSGGAILVISEGVFGMRGEQGPLKEIVALKKDYEFRFMVDDAHGFGTLGKTGAGAGEEQGVQDEIDIYFATFAKSMASVGAFIAGDQQMVEYLRYNTRSQVFAKTLPMALTVSAKKRLDMIKTMPELKDKLWSNVRMLQSGLKERGFDIGNTNSCVTPVYMNGSLPEALNLIVDMRENYHIFCSIVVYPVIPKGMMLLRLIPSAAHTEEDIELTLNAFSAVYDKLKSGEYAKTPVDLAAIK
ncbi:MAG: aminotransferase class I/II-fold pyridoxal phosphate-dependent enzyme [Chitinophagales bacterium]